MKIESDRMVTKISDNNGAIFIFKPHPPYTVAIGKTHYSFTDKKNIIDFYNALHKLKTFVENEEKTQKTNKQWVDLLVKGEGR